MQSEWSKWSQWPTEQEAAALLGTSVKTIARYAQKGKIEIRKRPRPGRKPENVCNPSDLERLQPAAHVVPDHDQVLDAEPVDEALPALRPTRADEFQFLIQTIATVIETKRTATEKRFLTLKEASACGLSVAFLRRAARDGRLPSIRDGRVIKIAREALAKL